MGVKQTKTEPLKTVLIIIIGMIIIYLSTDWRWSLGVAVIVGVSSLVSGYLARKIDYLWMKLAWLLSFVIPNVLLSLFFFLFLTPIALISRIFDREKQLSLQNTRDSLFKDYKKQFTKGSFEKPW